MLIARLLRNEPVEGLQRLGRVGLFTIGCAVILLVSDSWRVPAGVPRGVGYFSPSTYAQAAAKGTIEITRDFDWDAARQGSSGAEDTGYPILRQAWLLMGGDGSFETIAELHNVFVVGCAVAFATGAAVMLRSVLAGWLSLALALVVRYALRGFLFGALDNRTLIVFFPLAFSLLVVLVGPSTRRIHLPVGVLSALGIGGIIEMADLVRHSEGMLAFWGIVLACLLVKAPLWRRAATVAVVVLGSGLVMYAVPMGVRLFNDVQTGRYAGGILPYLVRPTRPFHHSPWHSLQISLGRYPNPEELFYNDLDGFLRVQKAFPELVKSAGPYEAARAYYLWYVRAHPLDWARSLARGTLEVFYFIPYATSVGSSPWAWGNLPAKEGVIPGLIVDPRDVGCYRAPQLCGVHGSLVNLRLRYLKLTIFEWMVFVGSLACLAAAVWATGVAGDMENRRVFLALLSYVGLGVGVRALIPAYGTALVVAYWGVSILALVYLLGFAWRALRKRDRVGDLVP